MFIALGFNPAVFAVTVTPLIIIILSLAIGATPPHQTAVLFQLPVLIATATPAAFVILVVVIASFVVFPSPTTMAVASNV